MARILNLEAYPLATTISDDSYLVGTDATDNKETKNFKIEDLKTHILPDPLTEGVYFNATVTVDADGQISSVASGSTTGLGLTTTGTSGAATLIGNTLNIPVYAGTLQGVLDNGAISSNSSNTQIQVFDAGTPTRLSKVSVLDYQTDLFSQNGPTGDTSIIKAAYGTAEIRGYNGSNAGIFEAQPDQIRMEVTNGTNDIHLDLSTASGAVFTDTLNTKGLEYAADYSASFTARSLVDKDYVDSNVPSGVALVGTYTDGYVPRWNATTNTLESGTIQDNGTGIGIGTSPSSSSVLKAYNTTTTGAGTGIDGRVRHNGTITLGNLHGIFGYVQAINSGDTTTANAVSATVQNSGTGTITNARAFHSQAFSGTGSITNVYGLYLENQTIGTTNYGVYQEGSTNKNYLAGQLQLGYTSGTAGQFLKSADTSGNAEWAAITAGDVTGAVTATSGSATQVAVFDGTDSIIGDANLIFSSGQLGIGTVPDTELHVKGAGTILKLETTNTTGNNYLAFFDSVGQKGYVGYASGSNENLTMLNDEAGGQMNFWTTDSGNNTTRALTITDDQDVEINAGNLEVDGQAYSTIQTSTYTPTAAFQIDWDLGNVAIVDLGSATTDIQVGFLNLKPGANYFIKVIQHATSAVNLTFPSAGTGATKFPGGTAPTISTGASAVDAIALTCISTTELLGNFSQDYQ